VAKRKRRRKKAWNNKVAKAKDGHILDSKSEKRIDDILSKYGIPHLVHVKYPNSAMVCDFYLPEQKVYLEYFGLAGASERYDERIEVKKALCEALGIRMVGIYPCDIYRRRGKAWEKEIVERILGAAG